MPITIQIADLNNQAVSLGVVTHESLTLALIAAFGRSRAQALEVRFQRMLGQSGNDPADDVPFQLLAGKGKGEVQVTSVSLVVHSAGDHQELGTFDLTGASLLSYSEHDDGANLHGSLTVRASVLTYTPAGGASAINLDVLNP